MQITHITKNEEQLLQRTHVLAEASVEKQTPSNEDVKQELGKKLGADTALIAIKSIHNTFGDRKIKVEAYLYQNQKAFEILGVQKKKEKKEAEPKEEKK